MKCYILVNKIAIDFEKSDLFVAFYVQNPTLIRFPIVSTRGS